MKLIKYFVFILLSFFFQVAWAEQNIPALNSPVMDTANMLSHNYSKQLENRLLTYSQEKGSQIIVFTVDTVQPETPFEFGTRAFDKWKVGRKNIDDGVIFLLVKNERKSQILVGRGLEGAIPDAYAKRILNDIMPDMRNGNTDSAVELAVNSLQKLIDGEALPEYIPNNADENISSALLYFFLLFAFVASFIKNAIEDEKKALIFQLSISSIVFLVVLLISHSIFLAIVFAFIILVITVDGGGSFGGGSGGFRSGGSLGGGGFSGGGGSFGGGGASGSW